MLSAARRVWGQGSGPLVASAFHRWLGLVALIAFWSFGVQADVLIGSRGLLPVADWMTQLQGREPGLLELPTYLRYSASDTAISLGVWLGVALSLLALFGKAPRVCFALIAPLYLSFLVAGRSFMTFAWDLLLIEAAFLAVFLPRDRPSRTLHFVFRVLLFKLYWESGLAKLQSHLMDWHDLSAMTFYYETAPIPTRLGWTWHHLSEAWHHVESAFGMGFELFIAPLIFGPRAARLIALATFTAFQLVNLLTANYGFFVYTALGLHLFLLDDRDLARLGAWWKRQKTRVARLFERPRIPTLTGEPPPPSPWQRLRERCRALRDGLAERRRRALSRGLLGAWARARRTRLWHRAWYLALVLPVTLVWLTLSLRAGLDYFTRPAEVCESRRPRECIPRGPLTDGFLEATEPLAPLSRLRVANRYHLFGHITRERIEPEVQTLDPATGEWTAHHLHYKPGPLDRAPPFVAPHQPRVDFRLWFYGLRVRQGDTRMPLYVSNLLDRLCHDPEAIQSLFPEPLPAAPRAVRFAFYTYRFTTPEERERARPLERWWRRERIGQLRPRVCSARSRDRRGIPGQ